MPFFLPVTDPRLFRCACGRPDCDAPPPSAKLLDALEALRRVYGGPIIVTSGPRCRDWNAEQKGEPNSEHLYGDAADLACPTSAVRWNLVSAARHVGILRLGIGPSFLHVGVSDRAQHPKYVEWTYYGSPRAS